MGKEKIAKKILLVDDEAGFAELMRELLVSAGYEVAVANDGQEGLDKLKTFMPDAIVTDVVMSRMNGFEMFKKVREDPSMAEIPFLFITGFQDDRVLQEARKIGVFGILRKPVDIEQIENRLKELIKP